MNALRRIAIVTRQFRPCVGGAERMLERLATSFAGRGIETSVVTARWESHWPAREDLEGVAIHRVAQGRTRLIQTLRYMAGIRRWLHAARGQFDLVLVSMLKHSAAATIGAVDANTPVVLRAAGAGRAGDCAWLASARGGRCIRRRCLRADALVCPGRPLADELREAGFPEDRICVIPNGVPIPSAPDRDVGRRRLEAIAGIRFEPSAPVAVFVGRLSEEKGAAQLPALWRGVVDRRPEARLIVVGDGPLLSQVREDLERHSLHRHVRCLGHRDDVLQWLSAADLFLLPSREEGMSVALLEAMAQGLCPVASDIPANRDVVANAETGRLVAPGEPRRWAEAILTLLAQPDEMQRLGRAARAHVSEKHALERTAQRYLELFEQLIDARRRSF